MKIEYKELIEIRNKIIENTNKELEYNYEFKLELVNSILNKIKYSENSSEILTEIITDAITKNENEIIENIIIEKLIHIINLDELYSYLEIHINKRISEDKLFNTEYLTILEDELYSYDYIELSDRLSDYINSSDIKKDKIYLSEIFSSDELKELNEFLNESNFISEYIECLE